MSLLAALVSAASGCLQHPGATGEIDFAGPAAAASGGEANDASDRSPLGASDRMPGYYRFVAALRARGFSFMSFGDFWRAERSTLPEKLIVVRHDVHRRDIAPAYDMHTIEAQLLPPGSATYFVMLGFPKESGDASTQQQYLDLIATLSSDDVDVQPHVSPDDMYVSAYKPSWRKKSRAQLAAFTAGDYAVVSYDDGVEIETRSTDVLDLRTMDRDLVGLLQEYNQRWTEQTGLVPRYYAAHGSNLALNHVLNNATILDQRELIASGVYEFDVYNTRVHEWLADLSDNEQPDWMDHPETIVDGRYQLLAHPRLWQADESAARALRDTQGYDGAAGAALK